MCVCGVLFIQISTAHTVQSPFSLFSFSLRSCTGTARSFLPLQTGLRPIHVAVVSEQLDVIVTLIDDFGVDPNGFSLSRVK